MFTDQKVVLGVDRLDYTKGLVHRLKTFEKLLEKHPDHIEKVRWIHIHTHKILLSILCPFILITICH
jgi:trehalose-6-phosphate synthase